MTGSWYGGSRPGGHCVLGLGGPRLRRGSSCGAVGGSLSSKYRGSLRFPRRGVAPCRIQEGPPLPRGSPDPECGGGLPALLGCGGFTGSRPPAGAGRKPLSRWGARSPPLRAARPCAPGPRPDPGSGCGSGSRSAWCSGPGPGARPGCAPSRHRGSALQPARTCPPGPRLRPPARAPPPAPLSAPLGARPRATALTSRAPALPPRVAGRRFSPRGPTTRFRPRWVLAPVAPALAPTPQPTPRRF